MRLVDCFVRPGFRPEQLHWWRTASGVFLTTTVFLLHSFLNAPIPGAGEPHYLSKARASIDPAWCERDFFLQSGTPHYWFYALTGPPTQVFSFQVVAATGRILSLLLLATAWHRLAATLHLTRRNTVLSAALFCLIAASGSFSGEWIVGGFESKVPAWAFGLFGVALWIESHESQRRRKLFHSGIGNGLATLLHPVVGTWVVIAIGMVESARLLHSLRGHFAAGSPHNVPRQGNSFPRFVTDATCFLIPNLIIGTAGVVPALHVLDKSGMTSDQIVYADVIQVFWRLPHHLDPTVFWKEGALHTVATATVGIAGFLLLQRNGLSRFSCRKALSDLWYLLGMAGIIAAVGFVIGWHSESFQQLTHSHWRAALLKFYPFRLFDGLLPIITSLTVCAAIQAWISPVLILLFPSRTRLGFWLPVLALVAACSWTSRNPTPSLFSPGHFSQWKNICRTIQQSTPEDALFVTPTISWGFKWYAQRAEYVCFKDCPQEPSGILEWNQRLWKMTGWQDAAYSDNVVTQQELMQLASLTGAEYLLTRDGLTGQKVHFNSPVVLEHGVWQLYELPADGAGLP
ncbi:MAG: hypothetical protein KDA96_03615 [Planctomycetaceae bacterium]|nr:hypothetical protein [Planctomycetaceae bacterium]